MNASAAHAASEVLEEHAEGDLKGIFEDIKRTFRAPVVSLPFGALATEPDYLRVAWRQLHTNAQTLYFEEQADEIRRYAVHSMSEIGELRTPASDETLARTLSAFHYLNPKILLGVAALRSSLLGQLPRTSVLPTGLKRQVVPGIAREMPTITLTDPSTTNDRLRRIFDEIRSVSPSGMVDTEYRALAAWPDYLEGAWSSVKPRLATPEYRRATRQLRWMADEAVLSFPFRMDATSHTLRHAGLSEQQLDTVRSCWIGSIERPPSQWQMSRCSLRASKGNERPWKIDTRWTWSNASGLSRGQLQRGNSNVVVSPSFDRSIYQVIGSGL